MPISSIRSATRFILLATALLGLVSCRLPQALSQRFFASERTGVPRAADCERCHQEIYREWQDSLHADAWTSEAFQTASVGGRASECVSCHAPAALDAEGPVRARSVHVDEGVSCITCHLASGDGAAPFTMRGPISRTSPVEVHPIIEEDPMYRSSELCGGCHRGAFEEWSAAAEDEEDPKTCQECHMPSVHRKVESVNAQVPYSSLFVALGSERELRRHLFAVPSDATQDIEFAVERRNLEQGVELSVTVRNHLPHALPTGRFGRRELRVAVEWSGGEHSWTYSRALGEAIPSGGERSHRLSVPTDATLRIRLQRWDHRSRSWETLLEGSP